jgi:hypothetical protein
MKIRSIAIAVIALGASLFGAAPAHAADYATEVTFADWVDGARWDTTNAWYVQVTVRDTVVGQTLAGNSNCTTGVGTVHFSYSTSRGASGTLPDNCVDIHGLAFAILPDAARFALVPGEVVTFSASFTSTEASSYASTTRAGTARVTAIATPTQIDLYESYGFDVSASAIGVTTGLQPYGYDGDPYAEAPAGSWTIRVTAPGGAEVARLNRTGGPSGMVVDWVVEDLDPATLYTVVARYDVAASDLGRRSNPTEVSLDVRTLEGAAVADDESTEAADEVDAAADSETDTASAPVGTDEKSDDARELDAEAASSSSPLLPIIVGVSVVVLLAAGTVGFFWLRARRTIV